MFSHIVLCELHAHLIDVVTVVLMNIMAGIYPREESLQLSVSPRSDIVSPSATEDSCADPRAFSRKDNGMGTMASPGQQEMSETVAKSCMSLVSDDSPTGASSVTQSAEPLRPLPNTISNPLVSPHSRTSALRRSDGWSSMDTDAINPRNENRKQQGPISVQPRRVDASWALQNLNGLLNGDVGSYLSPPQENVKALDVKVMPVAKLSTSKSTPTLSSAQVNPLQLPSNGRSPVQPQIVGDRSSSQVRRGTFMTKKQGPLAPPLCTVCKHKTPEFGKAVRRFSYAELLYATDNFNHHNYLAQGGYGSVYRGILPEGQLIAVKQHKIASNQGDEEFCAEVEVLSCAQHRNLVTLIGYCVENGRRLLVYEYVCNGSLDRHLSGKYHSIHDVIWNAWSFLY